MGRASYATEIDLSKQDNSTTVNNVKFDVYLDANDRSKKQISKDINSDDLSLFISITVQGGGRLENSKVEFSNSNFELKDNNKVFEKNIETISSENGITVELPIVSRKNSSYDLSLLNMYSQINLTGEYIDDDGNVTDINTTKMVNIEWQADEITEEQVELNQEVITNKIYNIDGINKRIVQVLLKTNIQGNIAPIKSTKIEIEVPEIGVKPEQVKVVANNTLATNGKTNIEFGDSESSKYEYNEEEGKINIKVLNNPNSNNIISWQKNVTDEYIITYVYDEETEILPFISKAKNTIDIYGRTKGEIVKQSELSLENIEEIGDAASLESTITEKIYKGNMYIGEDSNYETKWNVFVTYSDLAKVIVLLDSGDTIDTENLSTYYKSTKINKAKAIDLLGENGIIRVYDETDIETPIKEIKLSEENQEEYYTINYGENINKIIIETTAAVKEGKLEIINEKAIKVLNQENLETATKLASEAKLVISDEEANIAVNLDKKSNSSLVEPVTTIDVSTDKTSISNQTENTLRLTAVLEANNPSNKLFKNPEINIELPKEITEVSIENKALLDDELKIASSEILPNENGNKVIKLVLQGEQTKYTSPAQGGANLVLDLKVKAEEFISDKNVEIKTTCINDGENAEKTNKIGIVSKFGILNKSSITVGDSIVEEINKNSININAEGNEEIEISTSIINNYREKMSSMMILGSIPSDAKLKSAISVNMENAVVYYSEEENATADSESWKTEVTTFDNIKTFKIVGTEVEQGEVITLNYKYELNQTAADSTKSTIKINGTVGNQTKEETLTYITSGSEASEDLELSSVGETTNAEKISVEVIPTIGGNSAVPTTEVNNGQVIRYKVKVKNTSSETINNLKINATIENGVFYDLVEDGGSFLDRETGEMVKSHSYAEVTGVDNKEFTKEELKAGETTEFEYQVVAYIGAGANANKFKNSILVTGDNIEDLTTSDTKTIKEAKLALKLHYSSNEEPKLYSNGDIKTFEIDLTNLTENNLENIPVKITLPEEVTCDVEKQTYFNTDEASINVVNNQVNINVYELGAKETKKIYVELGTNSIPLDETETNILLVATADYNGNTYLSNEYVRTMFQTETNLNVEFTSNKIEETLYLDKEDTITYTLTLKNTGLLETGSLYIFDEIPFELKVTNITAQKNNEASKEYESNEDGDVCINDISLKPGDSLKVTITAVLDSVPKDNAEITNTISISGSAVNKIEKQLINTVEIISEKPEEPEPDPEPIPDPDPTPDPDPIPDPTPDPEDEAYSISGLAWLDANKNGTRDNNEDILKGIKVLLLDKEGNVVKDKENKEISTMTTITGTYKFSDIEKGEYIVVFIYDTGKYTVSKYQVEGATEEQNSDVISKQITINNEAKLVGATDIIKIENSDIKNIDIGLIENAKFDLSLEKYVSKVVVTNDTESVDYDFGEKTLAKVEIAAKKLASSTILVQYEIKISNDGDVQGYVSDVIDYLPKELTFNSEMNPDWYLDSEGKLHNASLTKEAIEPGKTETVKLVLTKTLSNNSTGTIENIAEIGSSTNLEGIEDIDSVGGNKNTGEDDIGSASLIISIKTGSPIMYIGIVIASMTVIGLGIFIINKKVLENRV